MFIIILLGTDGLRYRKEYARFERPQKLSTLPVVNSVDKPVDNPSSH
jgi:hypothetical protein